MCGSNNKNMQAKAQNKDENGIYTADDLCAFTFAINNNKDLRSWQAEDGKIHLKADIDMIDVGSNQIGAGTIFRGVFDGEGHVISNITIQKKLGAVGLFGNNVGMIKNVHVRSATISSHLQTAVGGIVGCNRGYIMGCSFEGQLYMGNHVGGIAGKNHGLVLACYMINLHEDHVNLNWNPRDRNIFGGIVGYNTGTIFACYSNYFSYHLLNNERNYYHGIIAGADTGKISHCYWRPSANEIGKTNQAKGIGNAEGSDITFCTQEDVTGILNLSLNSSPISCEYKLKGAWPNWKFEKRSIEDGILQFETLPNDDSNP